MYMRYRQQTRADLKFYLQKHFDELFPPLPEPSHEALAQAALFVVLRDQPAAAPSLSPSPSPWTSLPSRRFTGDVYERAIALQLEDADATPMSVRVRALADGRFDNTSQITFDSVIVTTGGAGEPSSASVIILRASRRGRRSRSG